MKDHKGQGNTYLESVYLDNGSEVIKIIVW